VETLDLSFAANFVSFAANFVVRLERACCPKEVVVVIPSERRDNGMLPDTGNPHKRIAYGT